MNWIIGDIHGMLRPLRALVEVITHTDPAAQLTFAGDYVNRGPDSRGVIDYLLTLRNCRFVRGNHDDVLDFLLSGKSVVADLPDDPCTVFFWFIDQGLDRTLESYGIDYADLQQMARRCSPRVLRRMFDVVPPAHREFLRTLPLVAEDKAFFVAHGYADINAKNEVGFGAHSAADPEFRRQTLWNRPSDEEILLPKAWARVGYFGHTPVNNFDPPLFDGQMVPLRGPNMVMLDTAVAMHPDGRLSAVCHETGSVVQADRQGQVIRPGDAPGAQPPIATKAGTNT